MTLPSSTYQLLMEGDEYHLLVEGRLVVRMRGCMAGLIYAKYRHLVEIHGEHEARIYLSGVADGYGHMLDKSIHETLTEAAAVGRKLRQLDERLKN